MRGTFATIKCGSGVPPNVPHVSPAYIIKMMLWNIGTFKMSKIISKRILDLKSVVWANYVFNKQKTGTTLKKCSNVPLELSPCIRTLFAGTFKCSTFDENVPLRNLNCWRCHA